MGRASYVGGLFLALMQQPPKGGFFVGENVMKNRLTVFGTIEFCRAKFVGKSYSSKHIGGNGILASLAAAKHAKVDLIGVIGSDMDRTKLGALLGKNITISNTKQLQGKSFDYGAVYDPKKFELIDEDISFGVYSSYTPHIINSKARASEYVLFSGSNPRFSIGILKQIKRPKEVAVNTLLYHLKNNLPYTLDLIGNATYLFTNTKEYAYLKTQINQDIFKRFKKLKYIFKTKGKNGVEVIERNCSYNFSLRKKIIPKDPTNAGDVFVGTIMGMIIAGFHMEKDLEQIVRIAQEESARVIVNDPYYRLKA